MRYLVFLIAVLFTSLTFALVKTDNITTNNPSKGFIDFLKSIDVQTATGIYLPSGTTAERPTPSKDGIVRYNTDLDKVEVYAGGSWQTVGGGISNWQTATSYSIGDVVIESEKIYQALTDHTSGTFATDLANGDWVEVSGMQIVDLATGVTGVLPVANGGTGSATQNFVDLTTNQTVAGEKTFSNTIKSDSIQTTGSSGVVIKNSSGTTVADFGPANTTNASIAGGLNTGGNIAATGTVTGSNLSGTNTGDLLGQAQSEGSASTITTLETPLDQLTTTDTNKRLIETGNDNVIKDPAFEGNSLQWVTYADAAGTAPVDGTGGTANVTVAYTTTSPLKGKKSMLFTKDAANRQGQGASINFTIPDINKGKVNNIKISYDIVSGTYATGDLTMWVINVDPASASNGRVIQPSAYTIENSGLKESKFLEFQSDIDSNLYRLVVHVTSTSASAYSLRFDEVDVSLGEKVYGSVTTDSVSATFTLTNTGNATVTGTVSKLGSKAVFKGRIVMGSSLPTGVITLNLPAGYSMSNTTNFTEYSTIGFAASSYYVGKAYPNSSTSVQFYGGTVTSSAWTASVPATWVATNYIEFSFAVEIAGWSSSQQLSNDADTRVISGRISKNSSQSISNDTATVVTFDTTPSHDYSAMWESGSSGWRIKTSGDYRVVARLAWASNASGTRFISIQKNGVNVATMYSTAHPAGEFMLGVDEIIPAVAGDLIRVSVYQNSGSSVNINNTSGNSFSIQRVSGPSQIAASETVSALYTGAPPTGGLTGSFAKVTFGTKVKDSHNQYSNGVYTIPEAGSYDISAQIAVQGTFALNNDTEIAVYIDGVLSYRGGLKSGGAVTAMIAAVNVKAVPLLRGQQIEFRVFTQGSSVSYVSASPYNFFSINRSGNY